MNKFDKICHDIKTLKIQGARNIAIAGIRALLIKHDKNSVKKLLNTRPTEPALENTIKFILKDIKKNPRLAYQHFENSKKIIEEFGSKLIKKNLTIFTHCHSSTVMSILKKVKPKVNQTETRPLYQGRLTAKELIKAKVPTTQYIDSAARYAIKNSDLVLLGCDAINHKGVVINKIGSEIFCEVAYKRKIPVYIATNSWKYDPHSIHERIKIEQRDTKEIWKNPPKGLKIKNPAFEKINPKLIKGIISELGIHTPKQFVKEVKKRYPWMIS